MVMSAAEAGLQRGTLVMQPANSQIMKSFRFSEIKNQKSEWSEWDEYAVLGSRRMD